jgi:hypothetical protein
MSKAELVEQVNRNLVILSMAAPDSLTKAVRAKVINQDVDQLQEVLQESYRLIEELYGRVCPFEYAEQLSFFFIS